MNIAWSRRPLSDAGPDRRVRNVARNTFSGPYRVFADHTYRVITAASRISGPRR